MRRLGAAELTRKELERRLAETQDTLMKAVNDLDNEKSDAKKAKDAAVEMLHQQMETMRRAVEEKEAELAHTQAVREEMGALLQAAGIDYVPPERFAGDYAASGRYDSGGRIPPGGRIGPGGMVLDASGKPVIDPATGRPRILAPGLGMQPGGAGALMPFGGGGGRDPRIPPGGRVGPGGVIMDASGKPVVDPRTGRPMVASSNSFGGMGSMGGAIGGAGGGGYGGGYGGAGAGGYGGGGGLGGGMAGEGDGGGYDMSAVPPGGRVGADGTVLDASGNPVLGADGKPMKAARRRGGHGHAGFGGGYVASAGGGGGGVQIPPGGSVGEGGVVLDASGQPVLGADGQPMRLVDPRVPAGGSIGPGGVILDASGASRGQGRQAAQSRAARRLRGGGFDATDPRIPAGGSIGANGEILDASGQPMLRPATGKPMTARVVPGGGGGGGVQIPAGRLRGRGGVVLDASGQPVLGADGQPMRLSTRVFRRAARWPGGVI